MRTSLRLASLALLALVLAAAADPPADNGIVAALQPYVDRHELAGAVTLVANHEKVLSIDCAGWADIEKQLPMKPDSLFWIASQSKSMTCAAVMMLVDEGKLSLDDPVEKYLPEFKGQQVAEKGADGKITLVDPVHPITLRNVMSHTSGLPFATPFEHPTLDQRPLSERAASYGKAHLDFQPDSKYSYSNAGINTAARVLEVITGQKYEDFIQTRLFDPLGMKDTTFWPTEEQVARIAHSYTPNKAKDNLAPINIGQLRYPLTDHATRWPMPAGGLFATATDVAHFCQMLLNKGILDGKRVLSEAAVAEMTKRQTLPITKASYGFGLGVGGENFGHGGAESTNMDVNVKHDFIWVWMVQHAGYPGKGGDAQGAGQRAAWKAYAK
jgi:CubicO group peptidase (beta-lactamase class C family)